MNISVNGTTVSSVELSFNSWWDGVKPTYRKALKEGLEQEVFQFAEIYLGNRSDIEYQMGAKYEPVRALYLGSFVENGVIQNNFWACKSHSGQLVICDTYSDGSSNAYAAGTSTCAASVATCTTNNELCEKLANALAAA